MCLVGELEDIYVYVHPLPARVKGFVTKDDYDRHVIVVNENLCEQKRIDAFNHELLHIRLGHLFSEELVYSIERSVEYNEGNYQIKGQIFSSPLTI